MFRWILDDTRSLLADIRSFGRRLSTRWQWLRMRSRHRLDAAAGDLENIRRGAEARTRMCSHCRALIPAEARLCPECGERPGRPVTRGLSRVAENMMPAAVSVTSVVLTLNVGVYLLEHLVSTQLSRTLPSGLSDAAWWMALTALGSNTPALVTEGEVWRLLTYCFLHWGLLHIAMNSWALLAVGPLVEELYGARKLLIFYLLTGVAGGLASYLSRGALSVETGVGASGSIFGLIGVMAVWGWRRGGAMGAGVRAQMVQWAIYGLVMGFMFRFDNEAHLGGLLAGAGLAAVVPDGEPRGDSGRRAWEAAAWAAGLAIAAGFAMVSLEHRATIERLVAELQR
ncbi:MAG TPA: rhomboid family intramembrane serine protease [Candidatus Polarisedimenticolia bacterium]|nr:rhomboid family intramembrane serine protease [Candidatus Polarisedimenticolia bacterium]